MKRLTHSIMSVVGFVLVLIALAKMYGPTDNMAVMWGLVCLAVMVGTLLDVFIGWALNFGVYVIACLGIAGFVLGKRHRA